MEQIIAKILEIEAEAKKMVNDTYRKSVDMTGDIESESTKVRDEFMHRADARIEKICAEEQKFFDDSTAVMQQKHEQDIARLEDIYARNADAWCEDIFSRIIKK